MFGVLLAGEDLDRGTRRTALIDAAQHGPGGDMRRGGRPRLDAHARERVVPPDQPLGELANAPLAKRRSSGAAHGGGPRGGRGDRRSPAVRRRAGRKTIDRTTGQVCRIAGRVYGSKSSQSRPATDCVPARETDDLKMSQLAREWRRGKTKCDRIRPNFTLSVRNRLNEKENFRTFSCAGELNPSESLVAPARPYAHRARPPLDGRRGATHPHHNHRVQRDHRGASARPRPALRR